MWFPNRHCYSITTAKNHWRLWCLLAFFLMVLTTPRLEAQTPVATISSTVPATPAQSASAPTTDLSVSPQEEIQILDAIEAQSNTSAAGSSPSQGTTVSTNNQGQSVTTLNSNSSSVTTPAAAAASYAPPAAPTGLSVLILKEGVYLSWAAAPSNSPVTAYNVFRSTTPGFGYKQVNIKPLSAPYFLDGAQGSLSPPLNGEDYFYVIASSDSQGNVSPYSDEITATPEGMEIPQSAEEKAAAQKPKPKPTPVEEQVLKIPDTNGINLQLPAETSLAIQGYKKVDILLAFQNFDRPPINGVLPSVNTTTVNQELVVTLQGKVGRNVDVNVDYSDVNRAGGVDQTKQDISIKYHGDTDSAIQEVDFGDLQLVLPNTEFAGFSKQLFGLQAKMKFDQFNLTTFFAQTKGISETKVFQGNASQIDKYIQDISYVPYRYFLITRDYRPYTDPTSGQIVNGALPANNTEQIWVDPGTGVINPIGPNFNGLFEHWLPGRDYTVDYSTGIITFIRGLSVSCRIAVCFQTKDGHNVGFTTGSTTTIDLTPDTLYVPDDGIVGRIPPGSGKTVEGHLIKDNNNSTGGTSVNATALSPNYLVNYFSLGTDKIIPPQQDPNFVFQVISQGTNNVLQTGQGVSTVGAPNPWIYDVNLDLNVLTVSNSNFYIAPGTTPPVPNAATSFLWPERPFANLDTTGGSSSSNTPADVYDQTTTPNSLYSVHIHYSTQLNFFQMGRFNIIRGSESVFLDGRKLRRDVDYTFDYTSGFLDFVDKSILTPASQVVVTYEYAPFGTFSANNILGARAEYDVNDHFFIGSTFLESDAQQPIDVPQIGSTPNSLTLFDADAKLDLLSEDVQSLTGIVPGLENWKPPLAIKLSGEVAQSFYNPDTFSAEGENGVAMVDNMEGIDSVSGPSMNQSSWLVSSAPIQPIGFLPIVPMSASGPTNNRTRFYNAGASNPTMTIFQTIGTTTQVATSYTNYLSVGAAYGGETFANTQQPNDAVPVLQFPYSNLTNQQWAGVRSVISANGSDYSNVSFLQSWIYNDGNPKWIMVDFGVIDEDSNGNGILDYDTGLTAIPQVQANPDYGIPTYYYPGNPWTGSSEIPFPTGIIPIGSPPTNLLAGGETSSQEGVSVGTGTTYVTENMDGTGIINTNNAYYEYGFEANWTGWKQVKVPVSYTAADNETTTPDGTTYFFHTQNPAAANPTIIRTVRVWTTGVNSTPISGDFYIQNISFSHNLWQLAVDPTVAATEPVTVNSSKFDVNSISQNQNQSYVPSLRFITVQAGQDQSAILYQEKSLEITYNLSNGDIYGGLPAYYATRIFSQGLDFTDYDDIRMDLYMLSYRPGDVLFVRIGNDQADYYQYNIQLDTAAVSCLYNWGTVDVPINGSAGNRLQVGTPYINRATQISFGVISPTAPSTGHTGDLWINNLRVANANVRSGVARRADAAFVLGKNFATINTRYREVDSGFTEIDQTSTHFQHSTQWGGDFTSSGVTLFKQPLVTQASITRQDLYTEAALLNNPYYISLPNSRIDNATGSISYTKDLGPSFGRLTTLRLSGSTNYENDTYEDAYLSQPGVQGNTQKGEVIETLASTYDAPKNFFFIPWGANQFTESYSLTHDTQYFDNITLSSYDRTTRSQNYSWTNTTELVKNLVFTPGYTLTLVDATGNTNSPGVPGSVSGYTPFNQRYQPKIGVVYRGIPGLIPAVDFTGSNQYDYVSYPDGTRFNNANNVNYSLNLTPGSWFSLFQKMNLTIFGGLTESGTAAIPDIDQVRPLSFNERWLTTPAFDVALTGNQSVAHQLNASFRLFDVWDFRPTGSWTDQLSLLSQGTNPVKQDGDTLGLTTIYNKKILTLPLVNFSLDSAQVQYTHTGTIQYDSSVPDPTSANISNDTESDTYTITLPYDINKKAQGNIKLQRTIGYQNGLSTTNIPTFQYDDQASIEYDQKFAPNGEIHIPFTHLKIKLQDAIELQAVFLMEFINNQSTYIYNEVQSQRYRATINLNYNALKNLRIGLSLANEYFTNDLNSQLSYTLWQGEVSAEARF